jgi:hypothetical protein
MCYKNQPVTHRSNQMRYFYYLNLKLFTIYHIDTLQIVSSFFLKLPDVFRRLHRAIFRGIFKTKSLT